MTPNQLRKAGEALYGTYWQSDLAIALGMSARHMRRLVAGTAPVTEGIEADIRRVAKARIVAIKAVAAE